MVVCSEDCGKKMDMFLDHCFYQQVSLQLAHATVSDDVPTCRDVAIIYWFNISALEKMCGLVLHGCSYHFYSPYAP